MSNCPKSGQIEEGVVAAAVVSDLVATFAAVAVALAKSLLTEIFKFSH